MTPKNAAFPALIGSALVALVLTWDLIVNVLNVARGVTAPVLLVSSLIYAFGALTVTLFFWAFYKS